MYRSAALLPALALLLCLPAAAQEAGTAPDLPPACAAKAASPGGHAMAGHDAAAHKVDGGAQGDTERAMAAGGADAGHRALMDSMAAMAGMEAAMAAPDLDVAFVCGMIPHHRAAIAMARAELAHGDDPFARKMAEAIVAAQEREIAEMLAWLAEQPR